MQNDSFCFQLFEKRWAVYDGIDRVLCAIEQSAKVNIDDITQFNIISNNVEFLFGNDILDKCDEIRRELLELHAIGKQIDWNIQKQRDDPNHSGLCDRESELLMNVFKQQQSLSKAMEKYISFAKYTTQKR